jgi:hypothetical protein
MRQGKFQGHRHYSPTLAHLASHLPWPPTPVLSVLKASAVAHTTFLSQRTEGSFPCRTAHHSPSQLSTLPLHRHLKPPPMPCVVATEATSPMTASSGHKTPPSRVALAPSHHSPLRPRGAHREQPPLAIIRANGNVDENHTDTLLLPGPSTCSLHRCFTLPLASPFGCCALPQTKCSAEHSHPNSSKWSSHLKHRRRPVP